MQQRRPSYPVVCKVRMRRTRSPRAAGDIRDRVFTGRAQRACAYYMYMHMYMHMYMCMYDD